MPPPQTGPLNFEQAVAFARQKAAQQQQPSPAVGPSLQPIVSSGALPAVTASAPYPLATVVAPGFSAPARPPYPQQYPVTSVYMPMGYPARPTQPQLMRPPSNFSPAANAVAAAQQQSIYNNIVNYAAENAQTSGLTLPIPPV